MPPQEEQQGAKSLDLNLDDVNTWSHSHYVMRQCDGVGGWVQLKYRLCTIHMWMRNMQVEKREVAECAGAKSKI